MNRIGFIAGTLLPIFLISRLEEHSSFWLIIFVITFITAIYKRCGYVGIHSTAKRIGIIIAHFIPLLNMAVYIWLLSLSNSAYDGNQERVDIHPTFIRRLYSNLKVFWILIFSILSILQMFFLVPYTTHLPANLAKNDKARWNSYNSYGTFSYKPHEIPKNYNQYTDINYQKLALQETILGIACIAGYAITFTLKK